MSNNITINIRVIKFKKLYRNKWKMLLRNREVMNVSQTQNNSNKC